MHFNSPEFFAKLPTVLIHQTFLLPKFFTIHVQYMIYLKIETISKTHAPTIICCVANMCNYSHYLLCNYSDISDFLKVITFDFLVHCLKLPHYSH